MKKSLLTILLLTATVAAGEPSTNPAKTITIHIRNNNNVRTLTFAGSAGHFTFDESLKDSNIFKVVIVTAKENKKTIEIPRYKPGRNGTFFRFEDGKLELQALPPEGVLQ